MIPVNGMVYGGPTGTISAAQWPSTARNSQWSWPRNCTRESEGESRIWL